MPDIMQCMLLNWIKAQDAVDAGSHLADAFPTHATGEFLQPFVKKATQDLQARNLNFYKRVRFANAFKWRLLEKGVAAETAHDVTQTLLVNSSGLWAAPGMPKGGLAAPSTIEAAPLAERMPKDSDELNTLGVELIQQGRYAEARKYFHRAIARNPKNAEALSNQGYLWLIQGRFADAENQFRQALRIRPTDADTGARLGVALLNQGRLDKACAQFDKVLKTAPRCAAALTGMGTAARAAGRFAEAEKWFQRAMLADPGLAGPLAAIAGTRRMSASDSQWLANAEKAAHKAKSPIEEASLRFAIGKYFDDVADYSRAFTSYRHANTLLKPLAVPYEEHEHSRFVDDMSSVYTPQTLAAVQAGGGSSSARPVFVVGMPRSGTSLVEQILSSHPSVAGAGELKFWIDVAAAHEKEIRDHLLPLDLRQKLAADYLRTLDAQHRDTGHVVDKTPHNAEHLGLIHSVFPNARIIHVRRDPIDTCLSCYFQNFSLALNYTFDLNDLAAHYRQHTRLMAHWRKALPAGTLLEVNYEELVSQQESATRKLLAFLGLEWDASCLKFEHNPRPVITASSWQVRQPLYASSVQRWRHYSKFVEPLRKLERA
ncbi:MAG: sulfotransferase [Proteobacteria bacterium]|nr:sulfotransferase [Pseudomonadota bacterium]